MALGCHTRPAQLKADRQSHLHSNRLTPMLGRFEPPPLHRLDRRPNEILVAGRPLNQDLSDGAIGEDVKPEQTRALDSLSARRFRGPGLDLAAASKSSDSELKARYLRASLAHSQAKPVSSGSTAAPSRPCPWEHIPERRLSRRRPPPSKTVAPSRPRSGLYHCEQEKGRTRRRIGRRSRCRSPVDAANHLVRGRPHPQSAA